MLPFLSHKSASLCRIDSNLQLLTVATQMRHNFLGHLVNTTNAIPEDRNIMSPHGMKEKSENYMYTWAIGHPVCSSVKFIGSEFKMAHNGNFSELQNSER